MNYLALIPSNQDRNRYPGSKLTEYVVCHKIAELAAVKAVPWSDTVLVRTFPGQRESNDAWRLEGLYRQQAEAMTWLREVGATSGDSAIVNLHTDSGKDWSHVLGIYGGVIAQGSYLLANGVSWAVEQFMQTGDRRMWDYSAYVFYQESRPYPAALVELGSHEHPGDRDKLINHQGELADAILAGAGGFLQFTVPDPVPPRTADEAYWQTYADIPYNPDAAIARYWRACRDLGEIANIGPAVGPEEDGEPYGEVGKKVQRFANAIVVCDPAQGYVCRRALVVLEPKRWFPST